MDQYTQMKGGGKSRHLPIGTPGSCLTEDDRDVVVESVDMSGPKCRRCRIPVAPREVVSLQFTVSTGRPATVLELARKQAVSAFQCTTDDPALVVTVGTGVPRADASGRQGSDWAFVVTATWDTVTGSPDHHVLRDRVLGSDRRRMPDRRR